MEKPKRLENIDWTALIATCEAHMAFIYSSDYHEDNDDEHYIYDEALKAIYGKNIFEKLNKDVFI